VTGRVKPVPRRTCISCRQVRDKSELVRIVQAGAGVEVDFSRKQEGRGAYLCPSLRCWQGLRADRLGYALKAKVAPEAVDNLMEYARRTYGSG